MMTIQEIYGVRPGEVMAPCYLDIKLLNDCAHDLRLRVRGKIASYRALESQMAAARDLTERYHLRQQMKAQRLQLFVVFEVWREVRRDAAVMMEAYLEQIAKDKESGRKAA